MDEQKVKVGYIYHFLTRNVFWPRNISPMGIGTGNICVIGDTKLHHCFKKMLAQTYPNPSIHLHLEYTTSASDIPDCHILFIGKAAASRVSRILEQTQSRPILTVSDVRGFAEKGGMIEFVKVRQSGRTNIKTRVNTVIAEENGIVIGAELLLLSDLIEKREVMIITDHLH